MKNKIQITIPEPCHENWERMTINQKGKFCTSCQKNVIDFTESSDAVIIKAYKENPKLCGRFTTIQLNRNLIVSEEKNSMWVFIAASVIAFLGLGNQEVKAQGIVRMEQTNNKKETTQSVQNEIIPEIEITGTVNDSIYSLPGATIENSRTKIKTNTDVDGNFKINAKKGDEIAVSFIGMETYNFITTNSHHYIIMMQNSANSGTLGAVCIIKKRSFFSRIFNW